MPEGPEIRRAADRVERAIAGRAATAVHFAFPHLKKYQKRLAGKLVLSVETRGKAMLIHFDGDLSVYSHNQLYGRWYVMARGRTPKTNRSLRLAIHNGERSALLYSASEIDVIAASKLEAHPFLAKLGPDALSRDLTEDDFVRRVREPRFARRQAHALLLDQGFVAGIGNYLRSEILFVAGLHPTVRPGDLAAEEQRRLGRAIRRVTARAYRTGGITNDLALAKQLKAEGVRRAEYRHHVFTRGGRACFTCGAKIERAVMNSRKIFFCPRCQPATGPRKQGGR